MDGARTPLSFSGGHETDPRDHGRPVVLVAAALGVPVKVFREAFSLVHPAPAGAAPTAEKVHANKDALLGALAKYGVSNERLDEVSNYYRYTPESADLWRHGDAKGYATIENGAVKQFVITDSGAGYSSEPTIEVTGYPRVHARATVWYGKNLKKNGSVTKAQMVTKH